MCCILINSEWYPFSFGIVVVTLYSTYIARTGLCIAVMLTNCIQTPDSRHAGLFGECVCFISTHWKRPETLSSLPTTETHWVSPQRKSIEFYQNLCRICNQQRLRGENKSATSRTMNSWWCYVVCIIRILGVSCSSIIVIIHQNIECSMSSLLLSVWVCLSLCHHCPISTLVDVGCFVLTEYGPVKCSRVKLKVAILGHTKEDVCGFSSGVALFCL